LAIKRDTALKHRRQSNNSLQEVPTKNTAELSIVPGRRRRRRYTALRVFLRLILAAAVVCAGMYLFSNWDNIEPENFLFWLNDKLAGGVSGDGFPVEITGSSVVNMNNTKDGLALLTDNSLVVLNGKGGELFRRPHGFSKPIMRSNGKWILVADSSSNRLRLETRASTAVEMTVENKISSIDVGNSGCFAVATDSSKGYISEVAVYKQNKEEPVFRWYDSSMIVLDVAISPDEKSMAIVGITAEGGAMKSYLKIFDFDKDNPVAQHEQNDLMLFAVGYFPNGTIAAVGDSAVWVFNQSGTIQQKYSYDDRQISGFIIGESAVSVALHGYGGAETGTLITINSSGDKAYESIYEGAFRSITSYGSDVVLLTSEGLYRTDITGQKYTGEVIRDGRMISTLGKRVIVLGLNSLIETQLPTGREKN
jgi:hypothetical protein